MAAGVLSWLFLAATGLCVCAAHAGHGNGQNSNIAELTSANFDDLVGGTKAAVVEFYAPWCGHCKHLKPEFEKLATTFLDSEQVLISKLNGENYPEYSYKFNVRGFPTILWFARGSSTPTQEYWGERSAAALMNWIHAKLDDPAENPPDPDEPPPDFNISGRWVDIDGGEVTMTQDGAKVTAKPTEPQHWSSAHGSIKQHTIPRMPFNTVILSGTISEDATQIEWSNGVTWTKGSDQGGASDPTLVEAITPTALETETTGDDDLLRETTGAKTAGGGVPDDDQPSSDEPDQPPKRAGDMASKLTSDTGATTTHTEDHKIAQLTAANKAKEATLNKELMACRQRTVTMQTDMEGKEQHIAVLYCGMGVMLVIIGFVTCRGMGAVESHHGESEEWDTKV